MILFKDFFGLFDKREHVAHTQDAAGKTIWMKEVEVAKFFTRRYERDWTTNNFLDTECCTTARVAIEFGEDDTIEFEGCVKRFGRVDRVLTGHRVNDKERVIRIDRF